MSIYTHKNQAASGCIVAEDMLLTADMPTAAGSKMLEGYQSLFEAEVLTRAKQAGYEIGGKANVGEFAIDLLGETSYFGAEYSADVLCSPSAEILKQGEAAAVLALDVNGAVRRAAAQTGLCSIKPTYGTVSRFGTIPVACSGETVSVLACSTADCAKVLAAITGYDEKDGTSLSEARVAAGKESLSRKGKVAVVTELLQGIDSEVAAKLEAAKAALSEQGIVVEAVSAQTISLAKAAWNILMSAELCNNVSRYDGVKYGYRAQDFSNIDELYTNSRTQAFGDLLKAAILFGSETLSTENYQKVYDKALRIRRVICEAFGALFAEYDAVLMPACSAMGYPKAAVEADRYLPFKENFYTAPASITGLPAVVAGGVQLVGSAFSEEMLLELAAVCAKEGK